MSTVAQVIGKFRRRFPQCDSSRALELFNETHREFCSRSQVRNGSEVVSLTAGVQEYDLSPSVVSIHEGYYERSSDPSDWLPLVETSTDEKVVMSRGWRMASTSAEPVQYYVTSSADGNSGKAQVGFWPVAPVSTSDGYPRVRLYVTSVVEMEESDEVPGQVLNDNIYVYGMWGKWLVEQQDASLSDLQAYQSLAEREMDRNVQHVKGVQENSATQLVPGFVLQTSRVR